MAPVEPDWGALGLRPVAISHRQPWTGPGYDELRPWSEEDGWPYAGVVLVDAAGAAVACAVWGPDPKGFDESRAGEVASVEAGLRVENDVAQTLRVSTHAAIVRLDVQPAWQGRGLGSYRLDRALAEMAIAGHAHVEMQTHVAKHARACQLDTRRGFTLEDAWASLVKTWALRGATAL